MITDLEFNDWLKADSAIRCVLVEVEVKEQGGAVVTRYLSNKAYITGPTSTPANTPYLPVITGSVSFSKSINLDGSVAISFGDLEIINTEGSLDFWLDDYWNNRKVSIYVGDLSWSREDFRLVITGLVTSIDSRKRDRLNLKLGDKLQRLNNPVTEAKLGGPTTRSDNLLPLCFGECHNVSPLLVDPSVNEYMVHNGAIERIIEVRDNGVPVAYTPFLSTGKFRLATAPAGAITCSAQGVKIPAAIAFQADTGLESATLGAVTSVAGSVSPPISGGTARSLIASATAGAHFLRHVDVMSLGASEVFTASAMYKAGSSPFAELRVYKSTNEAVGASVVFNLTTGLVVGNTVNTSEGGQLLDYGITPIGNGWYRVYLVAILSTAATNVVFQHTTRSPSNVLSWTGDGTTETLVFSGTMLERGQYPSQYIPGATIAGATYKSSIVSLAKHLMTSYGPASLRFVEADLDLKALSEFDSANPQPVGYYMTDRQNVLDVCNKLAASIGARFVMNTNGKCYAVKLSLPLSTTTNVVTNKNILEKSLEIKQVVPVVASVKIGYCRNWTVQNSLTTGILQEHAALYAEQWLTSTRTDSGAANNYNLFTEPAITETYLLTTFDAGAEAQRRLDIFKSQRKIVKYRGFYELLFQDIGIPQRLIFNRFNLNGVVGQVVSMATDLTSNRVDFEVLV